MEQDIAPDEIQKLAVGDAITYSKEGSVSEVPRRGTSLWFR